MNQKEADKIISEKPELIVSNFNNTAQSESQIIEDDDDMALFDAPQKKSISKSVELNNYSKVEENSKTENQSTKKLIESNKQSASQIIEEENTPIVDLNECVGDVSCFIILFYYLY